MTVKGWKGQERFKHSQTASVRIISRNAVTDDGDVMANKAPIKKDAKGGIKHFPYTEIEAKPVVMEGADKARMRLVIGKDHGAPTFYMRIFEVEPGGHTPYHQHPFEHENYIMDGKGELVRVDGKEPLKPGDIVFIPGGVMHQYRNAGKEVFRFICLIPKQD